MKDAKLSSLLRALVIIIIIILVTNFLIKYEITTLIFELIKTLLPFFFAFFMAWLMKPLGGFIHRKTKISIKMSNIIAVLISMVVVLGFLFVFIPLFIIQFFALIEISDTVVDGISTNAEKLISNNQDTILHAYRSIIEYINENQDKLNYAEISSQVVDFITSFVTSIVKGLTTSIIGLVSFIAQLVIGFIIAFYFINDITSFVDKLLKFILRDSFPKYKPIILEMSKTLFSYLRGLVLDCTILASIISIGCYFLGIPSPIFFGIVAGIFNVIPYLGPILGGVPIFLVALSQSWIIMLLSMVLVFGTQAFEANIMQPKIMSDATDLHPASVIVGLMIFSSLFGFIGMIISTPTLAIINVGLKNSRWDIHI